MREGSSQPHMHQICVAFGVQGAKLFLPLFFPSHHHIHIHTYIFTKIHTHTCTGTARHRHTATHHRHHVQPCAAAAASGASSSSHHHYHHQHHLHTHINTSLPPSSASPKEGLHLHLLPDAALATVAECLKPQDVIKSLQVVKHWALRVFAKEIKEVWLSSRQGPDEGGSTTRNAAGFADE